MTAEFQPQDSGAPEGALATCPLCGVSVVPGAERCSACRMHLGFGLDAPSPFRRMTTWGLVFALVAVYLATLAVVAVAR